MKQITLLLTLFFTSLQISAQINVDSLKTALEADTVNYYSKRIASLKLGYYESTDSLLKYVFMTAPMKDYMSKKAKKGIVLEIHSHNEKKLVTEIRYLDRNGKLHIPNEEEEQPHHARETYEYVSSEKYDTRINFRYDHNGEPFKNGFKIETDRKKDNNDMPIEMRHYNSESELLRYHVFNYLDNGKRVINTIYDKEGKLSSRNGVTHITFEFETPERKYPTQTKFYNKDYKPTHFKGSGSTIKVAIITYHYISQRNEVLLKYYNKKGKKVGSQHHYFYRKEILGDVDSPVIPKE